MFTRQIYDSGAYEHDLREWTGPEQYYLMPQAEHRDYTCLQDIVEMRPHNRMRNIAKSKDMVNIESDLLNLNRKNSRDPRKKYPFIKPSYTIDTIPVCTGKENNFNIIYPKLEGSQFNREKQIQVQRFESLCLNPQQSNRIRSNNVIGLNTRLYERDSHRPLVPVPVDQTNIFHKLPGT